MGFCLNHAWLSQEFCILFYFIFSQLFDIPAGPLAAAGATGGVGNGAILTLLDAEAAAEAAAFAAPAALCAAANAEAVLPEAAAVADAEAEAEADAAACISRADSRA